MHAIPLCANGWNIPVMNNTGPPAAEQPFWSVPLSDLFRRCGTDEQGLSSGEARLRLKKFGPNRLKPKREVNAVRLFLSQFTSPIILILLFAAVLSFFLGDPTDSIIIMVIVIFSGALGFWQEYEASNAVEDLMALVQLKAMVIRDGREIEVPFEEVVPGDIVVLNAGDGVPGDGRIIESKDLFVDEAALTGESYPAEKMPADLPADTALAKRTNALFMGTHVSSGSAKMLVVRTGKTTEFGKVSERLKFQLPETEFEHGVRQFGYLSDGGHHGADHGHLRHQRVPAPAGARVVHLLAGARRRPDAPAVAGDHQHQPGAGRQAHGRGRRSSSSSCPPSRTSAA